MRYGHKGLSSMFSFSQDIFRQLHIFIFSRRIPLASYSHFLKTYALQVFKLALTVANEEAAS